MRVPAVCAAQKLSSPDRHKKSPTELRRRTEEKQRSAELNRDKIMLEKQLKSKCVRAHVCVPLRARMHVRVRMQGGRGPHEGRHRSRGEEGGPDGDAHS